MEVEATNTHTHTHTHTFCATHPLHLTQARFARLVEITGSAVLVSYDGWWLKSVGQDDVGIHGCHIQVIDEGGLLSVCEVTKCFTHSHTSQKKTEGGLLQDAAI